MTTTESTIARLALEARSSQTSETDEAICEALAALPTAGMSYSLRQLITEASTYTMRETATAIAEELGRKF